MKKTFTINDQLVELSNLQKTQDELSFELSGKCYRFKRDERGSLIALDEQNNQQRVHLKAYENEFLIEGRTLSFDSGPVKSSKKGVKGNLMAPMPGKILKTFVKVGDKVKRGEPLLVLEAMKMEHTIKAPSNGLIEGLPFKDGDQVKAKVELVVFKPEEEGHA